jgi:ABC-type uncharacterized transport system auxiliary subunit
MMNFHDNHRFGLLALAFLLTSSCGAMLNSDKPVEKTYWLSPYTTSQSTDSSTHRPGLTVSFTVIPGLDSDRLLTLNPDAELNHFSAARWPDHLPEFVGSLVRRTLQQTGRYPHVSDGRNSGQHDCELELEAQEFYTRITPGGAAASVQISMAGHYDCQDTSHVLMLEANSTVAGRQITDIVAAHQRALNQLMQSLLAQIE